jgi:hypothetical protein
VQLDISLFWRIATYFQLNVPVPEGIQSEFEAELAFIAEISSASLQCSIRNCKHPLSFILDSLTTNLSTTEASTLLEEQKSCQLN